MHGALLSRLLYKCITGCLGTGDITFSITKFLVAIRGNEDICIKVVFMLTVNERFDFQEEARLVEFCCSVHKSFCTVHGSKYIISREVNTTVGQSLTVFSHTILITGDASSHSYDMFTLK
jgi:hypothetical protein